MAKMEKVVENGLHNYTAADQYQPPQSKAVQEHLQWFMGLKLGFMMHWAPGCQLGTYESWPLCDGDAAWSQEDFTWADAETCKQQYWDANKTFNPIKFDPAKWAKLAKDCGFQYLLFTTKHHDGFCMFDTQTTDYKITDAACPFHTNPNADVTAALYREFRKQGLAISTYFSKPDWHSDDYWHRAFGPAPTRNINYDAAEHPELWDRYVKFAHQQLRELGTRYGQIDVLWLDGGWVRPDIQGQDFRLGEIVEELRATTQPQMIVCDRTCGGAYENFVTPEKTVPDQAMNIPWETCTTVGEKFSFHYTDHFKSGGELVHLLLEVVSKGGNLALNLAPQPDGELPAAGVQSLQDMGQWLAIYGAGIYGTHAVAPYFTAPLCYTAKGQTLYVFYRYDLAAPQPTLPPALEFTCAAPVVGIYSLRTGVRLPYRQNGTAVTCFTRSLPMGGAFYAEGFRVETGAEL